MENAKDPKAHARVKHRKLVSHVLKTNSETSSETQASEHIGLVCTTDTSWTHDEWRPDEWNDGWSLEQWNDDWSSVGWHEDCEQTTDISVSSFSLEVWTSVLGVVRRDLNG